MDKHSDTLSTILKDRCAGRSLFIHQIVITLSSLQILASLTGLFALLAKKQGLFHQKLGGKSPKFQQLLLELFAKYSDERQWKPILLAEEKQYGCKLDRIEMIDYGEVESVVSESEATVREISFNIINYSRLMVEDYQALNGDDDGNSNVRLLFLPKLDDQTLSQYQSEATVSKLRGKPPSLAILVRFIETCLDKYNRAKMDQDAFNAKLLDSTKLSHVELHQVIWMLLIV